MGFEARNDTTRLRGFRAVVRGSNNEKPRGGPSSPLIGSFRAHATIASEGAALPAALPGVGWSDHWAFWQVGYQAVMVTDTAFYRDPNYHQLSDTPEQLDFERLARVVVGLHATILELAAAEN